MTIEVYSKQGCGICDAAKDKLRKMGLDYRALDLQATIEPHQGWRDDGSINVLAAYALIGTKLPVIRIDNEFHDYPSAMRHLKGLGLVGRASDSRNPGSESEGTH